MATRNMLVLFGSQTGCAQDVAERVGRDARRKGAIARVIVMDDYDRAQLINEEVVIFVCSTTGQGEEPDNMKMFWKFLLRKNLSPSILSHLRFGVFGLGDSSYTMFNFPAKKLHRRLVQLGAKPLLERGDGDDQHPRGLDGGLDPWINKLWEKIGDIWPETKLLPVTTDVLPPPSFNIRLAELESSRQTNVGPSEVPESASARQAKWLNGTIAFNTRMTAEDHFQDVRHIGTNFSEEVSYRAGDVLEIRPKNLDEDVDLILNHLGWLSIADQEVSISPGREDLEVPRHWDAVLTPRKLFRCYLDAFGRPRRYFFELLSFFATDPQHSEKLREFSTAEGQEELYAYCYRPRRTSFEVLQDFHSVKVPLTYLLDLFPEIRPRQFSIASHKALSENRIELAVAIVNYRTKLKAPRHGVCTKYLATLREGDRISCALRRGTFRVPHPGPPLIMIGPGTGVAPMRSFIQERLGGDGESVLFVGNRNAEKDFLFKSEWDTLTSENKLKIVTAFSRDQAAKIYVQHRISEQSQLIWNLLNVKGAIVLLSGSSKNIPDAVTAALEGVCLREGNLSVEKAKEYVEQLISRGRYQQECWS
ncbi:hypothetical protein BJ742DRAFT_816786 [Cladochytrium replicatum]|nr:hypothetical protein BJ742DRAFT_816786 [Cladochytrium replicatum]